MEDILEMILTIVCSPFEEPYDRLLQRISRIESKVARIIIKGAVILVPVLMVIGLASLCSYIFRGYWF